MDQSNQQLTQLMVELTSFISNDAQIYHKHKHELIKIVIDKNINEDLKLDNLQENILHFRVSLVDCHPTTSYGTTSQSTSHLTQKGRLVDLETFKNLDLRLQDFEKIVQIIDSVSKPSQIHSRLLESIANVIRSNDNSQQKLKAIKKLLI